MSWDMGSTDREDERWEHAKLMRQLREIGKEVHEECQAIVKQVEDAIKR